MTSLATSGAGRLIATSIALLAPFSPCPSQERECERVRAAESLAVLTQCDVSRPARLATRDVAPRYPEILWQAGVEGTVVAFVDSVAPDTSYHPDRSTRDASSRAIVRYALSTLITRLPGQKICAQALVGSLQLTNKARKEILRETGVELLDPGKCPRTYASMIYDPRRRPPKGHVDPIWLSIRTKVWSREFFAHTVEWESGTGGKARECVTRKSTASEWSAYCSNTQFSFVH